MATQGKVQSLYLDRNKENLIFPRTKIKAISDDNGVGLDAILSSTIYSNPDDLETAAAPINTDTLGGLPAADYATKIDLMVSEAETINKMRKANPYNLLDNSDFRNPINQRRQTTYQGQGYGLDRWFVTGGDASESFYVSVENGYVRLYNGSNVQHGLEQRFVHGFLNQNKVYTLAYKDYYGNIAVNRAPIAFYPNYGFDAVYLVLNPGETKPVVWIALYEGEYTEETLPEYHPKGYAQELLECMRYYVELDNWALGAGYVGDHGDVTIFLNTPIQMRIKPSIINSENIFVRYGGAEHVLHGRTLHAFDGAYSTTMRLAGSITASAQPLDAIVAYTPTKFALSAEL